MGNGKVGLISKLHNFVMDTHFHTKTNLFNRYYGKSFLELNEHFKNSSLVQVYLIIVTTILFIFHIFSRDIFSFLGFSFCTLFLAYNLRRIYIIMFAFPEGKNGADSYESD
jgi:hypothetical protein